MEEPMPSEETPAAAASGAHGDLLRVGDLNARRILALPDVAGAMGGDCEPEGIPA
jgi:hypothetical protein